MSTEYYHKRAREYEQIYAKPERANDIIQTKEKLKSVFQGKQVLDLGCGTGYWTTEISKTALSIHGVDINDSVLDIAREKAYDCPVKFERGDYHQLSEHRGKWNALFCGFVFSHIFRQERTQFWQGIKQNLMPESVCVLLDNLYIEGNSTPIFRSDSHGNTWQQRKLGSGETYEVIKNYPTKQELILLFEKETEFEYLEWDYYWMAICKLEA